MDDATAVLITVTGRDRPGVTSALLGALVPLGAQVIDMEQVVIRERLVLGLLVRLGGELDEARRELRALAAHLGVTVELERMASRRPGRELGRHHVCVLGQPLTVGALAAVTDRIAGCGANIDRIVRLSRYPITCFELLVSGCSSEPLHHALAQEAARQHVDIAVQRASLYRRAKRLVVLDVDSTLVQGEVIELLAEHAGVADEVRAVTEAAMRGELDFAASLRARVARLEGLDAGAIEHVRAHLRLTPGARTLIRTLHRLGYQTAVVSGGFTQVVEPLRAALGIHFAEANTLEVVDGRLTGRVVGPIVDRAGKAAALERFAAAAGVPVSQTVAVGDGANDLDMLARAGLGIAFNAKPVVRAQADTAVSVPYLDAILFLLGITREEIEEADSEAGDGVGPEAAAAGLGPALPG